MHMPFALVKTHFAAAPVKVGETCWLERFSGTKNQQNFFVDLLPFA